MKLNIKENRMDTAPEEYDIIKRICDKFNKKYRPPFTLKIDYFYEGTPHAEVTLKKHKFVGYASVSITDACRKIITKIAAKESVELSWNNTGSTFWINRSL